MNYSLTDADIKTIQLRTQQDAVGANGAHGIAPFSVGDVVRTVAPHATADLLAAEHLTHLLAIADQVPAALTSYLVLEGRLGEVAPQTDLSLCIRRIAAEPALLADCHPDLTLPTAWWNNKAWQRLRRFGEQWIDPRSLLATVVQDFWLEFDVDGPPPSPPVPSVFLGSKSIHPRGTQATATTVAWIVNDALSTLTGQREQAAFQAKLAACIDTLPGEAIIFQMGAMLARQPLTARVCVSRIRPEEVVAYVAALGWPGDQRALAMLLEEIAPLVGGNVALGLDLAGDLIGPKLGVELVAPVPQAPDTQIDMWQPLFSYLVDKGLCLPAKAEASLRFIDAPRASIAEPQAAQPFSATKRDILHLKVSLYPQQPMDAKVYLAVTYD